VVGQGHGPKEGPWLGVGFREWFREIGQGGGAKVQAVRGWV
jgi:hypothetical protein